MKYGDFLQTLRQVKPIKVEKPSLQQATKARISKEIVLNREKD